MSKNTKLIITGLFFFFLLMWTYSNHFNNGFYFDDSHTIVSNDYITDLGNIPMFFTDPATFSSLPANRAYRPWVTTMNAIDYSIEGKLVPFWFHVDIFFWYVLQCVLMFFLFRNMMNIAFRHRWNSYIALFTVGFYALHTANAETINYICARSDSFSTLCVIASLLLYQIPKARKYHLYLLTIILGIYTKQTAVMFVPILFLYILFFEEKVSLDNFRKGFIRAMIKAAPAAIVVIGLFLLNQLAFTPESTVSSNTGASKFAYFTTQFHIVVHYLKNFFLPINLSADPDFEIITPFSDSRIIFGLVVILTMLAIAYYTFKNVKTRPVTFGILWFFLALIPTSSFVPLFQIANDHRTFFPYVGLVLSVCWLLGLLIIKYEHVIEKRVILKYVLPFYSILLISAYAYGAHQRNKVWGDSETLWHDVTIKSPNNARGLMNYGNAQMAKAKYDVALDYFERALKLWPYYSYLHTNLGVLKGAMKKPEEAEQYFRNGIRYGAVNPESYYYYARWLQKQHRIEEAKKMLEDALVISPAHSKAKNLLNSIQNNLQQNEAPTLENMITQAKESPTPDNYLNLSLAHYRNGEYLLCIESAKKAIALKPDYALAYNNICSAYNQLKQWDKAIEACRKALEIIPDYELAKNNLKWAQDNSN